MEGDPNHCPSPRRVSPPLACPGASSVRSPTPGAPIAAATLALPCTPSERVRMWRETIARPAVPERELLRNMLFILNGINGTRVQLEVTTLGAGSIASDQQSVPVETVRVVFVDDGTHAIPAPIQQLIRRIVELGYLCKLVAGFVEERLHGTNIGLTMQAFCSFVDEDLRKHSRLVATLETQLKDGESCAAGSGASTALTLQTLALWTSDALLRMRVLSTIIEACKGSKGGALASIIHSYSGHGDPLVQSVAEALLDSVTRPMFKTLAKWIFEGELDDPFQEFFVQVNPDSGPDAPEVPTLGVAGPLLATHDAASFRQRRFRMRPEMLPTYISAQFGRKIFATGMSFNFVRYACDSSDWISAQDFHKKDQDLRYSDLGGLKRAVDKAHAIVSKHLSDVFLEKLQLVQHLRAMRDYSMLGKGDFADLLCEQLQPYLDQPSGCLQRRNITMALESAISRSSAQFDSSDITRRLDVRILEGSTSHVGWDVFTIEYTVESPISTILDGTAMQAYQVIFRHLWRIKRAEGAASQAWYTLTKARGVFRDLRQRDPLGQTLHAVAEVALLRLYGMTNMVRQMQSYVQLECCEYSWEDLMGKLREELDLDELIELHRKYIAGLLAKVLLRTSSRGHNTEFLTAKLRAALHTIRYYAQLCTQLTNLAYNLSATSPSEVETDPAEQERVKAEIEGFNTRLTQQSTRFQERWQPIADELDAMRASE